MFKDIATIIGYIASLAAMILYASKDNIAWTIVYAALFIGINISFYGGKK